MNDDTQNNEPAKADGQPDSVTRAVMPMVANMPKMASGWTRWWERDRGGVSFLSGESAIGAVGMDTGPEDVAIVLRLLRAGATLRTAGQHVGVSRSTAHRWARRFGREAERRTQPRLSDELKVAIGQLRKRGHSISSVATALMVSRCSVRRYATQYVAPVAVRCPGCGGKTFVLPCPVCEALNFRRS